MHQALVAERQRMLRAEAAHHRQIAAAKDRGLADSKAVRMARRSKLSVTGSLLAVALAALGTTTLVRPVAAQDDAHASGYPGQVYDSDWDGVDDTTESYYGMDPFNADMDGDGLRDGDEFFDRYARSDPTLYDTDGDGLGDGREVFALGTDPMLPDTDFDGWFDGLDGQPRNPSRH
jgi:hypothetical protein